MRSKPRSALMFHTAFPLHIFNMSFIVKTFIMRKAVNTILKIKRRVKNDLFKPPENYDKKNPITVVLCYI